MSGDLSPRATRAAGTRLDTSLGDDGSPSGAQAADPPAADPLRAARDFLSRLSGPSTILVAVSGGSDSIGLLLALRLALPSAAAGHRLVACTVDHALRDGSDLEAQAVAARCAGLGIAHHTARWSHAGLASGLQSRARLARYRLLLEVAERVGADLAVTGHTADDQAETIVMRAARNPDSTSPGLSGMADAVLFEGRLWFARPFLAVRRAAIRKTLRSLGEDWIEDPSNADRRFERVRIRQAAVPAFQASAPPVDRGASGEAMARHCGRHVVVHEGLVAEIALNAVDLDDPDWRRLLRILAATLGGKAHGFGRDTAERLVSTLQSAEDSVSTAGRVVFAARRTPGRPGGDRLFLYRENRDLPRATVPAQAMLVWDGRFAVENRTRVPILVQPSVAPVPGEDPDLGSARRPDADIAARLTACGVPKGIAADAARSAPRVVTPGMAAGSAQEPRARPVIAPFDTFLPRFDLMIADRIAQCFGRRTYPPCPVASQRPSPDAGKTSR